MKTNWGHVKKEVGDAVDALSSIRVYLEEMCGDPSKKGVMIAASAIRSTERQIQLVEEHLDVLYGELTQNCKVGPVEAAMKGARE